VHLEAAAAVAAFLEIALDFMGQTVGQEDLLAWEVDQVEERLVDDRATTMAAMHVREAIVPATTTTAAAAVVALVADLPAATAATAAKRKALWIARRSRDQGHPLQVAKEATWQKTAQTPLPIATATAAEGCKIWPPAVHFLHYYYHSPRLFLNFFVFFLLFSALVFLFFVPSLAAPSPPFLLSLYNACKTT
jgi:hypothetical protein